MTEINMDELLVAAGHETTPPGEDHVLMFKGERFVIKHEPDNLLRLAVAFERGNRATVLRELFGDDQFDRLIDLNPDGEECDALVKAVAALRSGGLEPGESSGSEGSSPTTSGPSSPNSGEFTA